MQQQPIQAQQPYQTKTLVLLGSDLDENPINKIAGFNVVVDPQRGNLEEIFLQFFKNTNARSFPTICVYAHGSAGDKGFPTIGDPYGKLNLGPKFTFGNGRSILVKELFHIMQLARARSNKLDIPCIIRLASCHMGLANQYITEAGPRVALMTYAGSKHAARKDFVDLGQIGYTKDEAIKGDPVEFIRRVVENGINLGVAITEVNGKQVLFQSGVKGVKKIPNHIKCGFRLRWLVDIVQNHDLEKLTLKEKAVLLSQVIKREFDRIVEELPDWWLEQFDHNKQEVKDSFQPVFTPEGARKYLLNAISGLLVMEDTGGKDANTLKNPTTNMKKVVEYVRELAGIPSNVDIIKMLHGHSYAFPQEYYGVVLSVMADLMPERISWLWSAASSLRSRASSIHMPLEDQISWFGEMSKVAKDFMRHEVIWLSKIALSPEAKHELSESCNHDPVMIKALSSLGACAAREGGATPQELLELYKRSQIEDLTALADLTSKGAIKAYRLGIKFKDLVAIRGYSKEIFADLTSPPAIESYRVGVCISELYAVHQDSKEKFTDLTSPTALDAYKCGVTLSNLYLIRNASKEKLTALTSPAATAMYRDQVKFLALASEYDLQPALIKKLTSPLAWILYKSGLKPAKALNNWEKTQKCIDDLSETFGGLKLGGNGVVGEFIKKSMTHIRQVLTDERCLTYFPNIVEAVFQGIVQQRDNLFYPAKTQEQVRKLVEKFRADIIRVQAENAKQSRLSRLFNPVKKVESYREHKAALEREEGPLNLPMWVDLSLKIAFDALAIIEPQRGLGCA